MVNSTLLSIFPPGSRGASEQAMFLMIVIGMEWAHDSPSPKHDGRVDGWMRHARKTLSFAHIKLNHRSWDYYSSVPVTAVRVPATSPGGQPLPRIQAELRCYRGTSSHKYPTTQKPLYPIASAAKSPRFFKCSGARSPATYLILILVGDKTDSQALTGTTVRRAGRPNLKAPVQRWNAASCEQRAGKPDGSDRSSIIHPNPSHPSINRDHDHAKKKSCCAWRICFQKSFFSPLPSRCFS